MHDSIRYPPDFNDLEAANEEIKKLRRQLFTANSKWVSVVEKAELTKRSLTGTIRSLQNQLTLLKGMLP